MKFSLVPKYESGCPHCGGEIAVDWSEADEKAEVCPHCGETIDREQCRAEEEGENEEVEYADLEIDFKKPAKGVVKEAAEDEGEKIEDDREREDENQDECEGENQDEDVEEEEEGAVEDESEEGRAAVDVEMPLPLTDEAMRKKAREDRALSAARKAHEEKNTTDAGEGLIFSRHDKFWKRGTIAFACPVCGRPIWVKKKQAGNQLTCNSCTSLISAPVPAEGRPAMAVEDKSTEADRKTALPSGILPEKGARAKRERDAPNLPGRKLTPPAEKKPRNGDDEDEDEVEDEVAREEFDAVQEEAEEEKTVPSPAEKKESFAAVKAMPSLELPPEEPPKDDWQGTAPTTPVPTRLETPGRVLLPAAGVLLALSIGGMIYLGFFEAGTDGKGPAGRDPGEAVLYKQLEDSVRTVLDPFFAAQSVEGKLKYVRHPDETRPRMQSHYAYYTDPPREYALKPGGILSADGEPPFIFSIVVLDGEKDRSIALEKTEDGLKIDWESYAGYSEMPLAQFISSAPEEPMDFRVNVKEVDYYNYDFADADRYRSFRLSNVWEEEYCYAYIERDHPDLKRVEKVMEKGLSMGAPHVPLILRLKSVPGGADRRQVKIVNLMHENWLHR